MPSTPAVSKTPATPEIKETPAPVEPSVGGEGDKTEQGEGREEEKEEE